MLGLKLIHVSKRGPRPQTSHIPHSKTQYIISWKIIRPLCCTTSTSWVTNMVHSSVTWIYMAHWGILMLVKYPRHVHRQGNWLLATECYVTEHGLHLTWELRRFPLRHWGWNKMVAKWQTAFSNAFSWINIRILFREYTYFVGLW